MPLKKLSEYLIQLKIADQSKIPFFKTNLKDTNSLSSDLLIK